MFDERSTNFNLQLPNRSGLLRFDVERLRTTITTLDILLKNIEAATNTPTIPALPAMVPRTAAMSGCISSY